MEGVDSEEFEVEGLSDGEIGREVGRDGGTRGDREVEDSLREWK